MGVIVDDIAVTSNSTPMASILKENFPASFDFKLCGTLHSLIGWNISVRANGIKISQSAFAQALLEKYGMQHANAVRVLLPRNADVTPARDDEPLLEPDDHKLYRSTIGSLLYL